MLNHEMDSAVLVKGWKKGANWGFPGGKINKDEDDLDCAIREVYEETGLDLRRAGLVSPEGRHKYIELPIKNHQVRLYVFRDVPMDTNFEPQTRKEISKIQWYPLSELPTFRKKGGQNAVPVVGANKFYMVAPFMVPLRKWVTAQKKIDEKRITSGQYLRPTMTIEETVTEDETASYEPVVQPREPAINTLDGATRELHRLLKMQPPTQGAQPPPPNSQDKGSALLSILQSKATGPAMAPQPNLYNPHTPQDFGAGAAPLPRNPHHHNNQQPVPFATQLPPPSFPLPPNQGPASWNPAQHQPHGGQPFAQGYQGINQQQYGNNNPPPALVHPQPLPPQVQRSIFNKSTFQEGPSPHLNAPAQNQNQHYAPQHGQALPPQMPQQPQTIPNPPKPALNGRSMELLGAFKRSADPPAPNGNAPPAQVGSHGSGQPSFYGQHSAPNNLPGLLNMAGKPNPSQNAPAGPGAGPQGAQHRSALLGMFKKASPDAAPSQQHGAGQASASKQADLLSHFMTADKRQPIPAGQPMPTGQPAPVNSGPAPGLSLENLFIQSRPAESGQAPAANPAQPVRILQRGQAAQQPSPNSQQPSIATKPPSYGNQPQPAPVDTSSSPAGTSPGLQNRRPGGNNDQKRQLLSLFGKQQGAPSSGGTSSHRGSTGSADAPRSRLSSLASGSEERRGSQTPMSPADQSFLLGYLQSVTNNASR